MLLSAAAGLAMLAGCTGGSAPTGPGASGSAGCDRSPAVPPGTTAELRVAVPPSIAAGTTSRPYWLHVPGRWIRTVTLPGRGADLDALTIGRGGVVWYADYGEGRIGAVTPDGGLDMFAPAEGAGELNDLTVGLDRAIWFTEQSGLVGRLAPDGAFSYVVMNVPGGAPNGIAAGPGATIWVAETGADAIARIAPRGPAARPGR